MLLAHGLGGRSDLPIPVWMALYGGAAVVAISFVAVGALWQRPRLRGGKAGRPLPVWLDRTLSSRPAKTLARTLGAVFWFAMISTAFAGPELSALNPAPTWFYVWFWVGLVPASVLFGPVWKAMNPLPPISRLLLRFIGEEVDDPPPDHRWAVFSLLIFLWLELVAPSSDRPSIVASFLVGYTIFNVAMSLRHGMRWYETSDGFQVYSQVFGSLSPFGRRDDGRLVIRSPLDSLATVAGDRSLAMVVVVILGSTAFDGLTRTSFYARLTDWAPNIAADQVIGAAALLLSVGFIWGSYSLAMSYTDRSGGEGGTAFGAFIHSLIPIALGYTVAHYFSLLIFQGQAGFILASDPFGRGWDLFGTATFDINYLAVSTSAIAWIQVGSIVGGHVLGVLSAHDRAVQLYPSGAGRSQIPMIVLMISYTMMGIGLLVGG